MKLGHKIIIQTNDYNIFLPHPHNFPPLRRLLLACAKASLHVLNEWLSNFQRLATDSLVLVPPICSRNLVCMKLHISRKCISFTRKGIMSNFNPASAQRNIFKK